MFKLFTATVVAMAIAAILTAESESHESKSKSKGSKSDQSKSQKGNDSRSNGLEAELSGFQEVPAISTAASGEFTARPNQAGTDFTYQLKYSGLEGTVLQAHIHLGQTAAIGGVMIFLCATAAAPGPAGTPTCPQQGTVTRTVTAADVIGPQGQGINAGEFAKVIRALRNEAAYVNVHSSKWPGGEIRGQISDDSRED